MTNLSFGISWGNRSIQKISHKWLFITPFIALTLSALSLPAQAIPARLAVGPDSNLPLLLETIRSAEASLEINIYQFDSLVIAQAIEAKIREGLIVRILIDGEPATTYRVSPATVDAVDFLRKAMREVTSNPRQQSLSWIRVMEDYANRRNRRYRFNHAKYIIADSRYVFVSSENFTKSGHANPDFVGNRGWDVVLDHPTSAQTFQSMFYADASLQHGDVSLVPLTGPIQLVTNPPDHSAPRPSKPRSAPRIPIVSVNVTQAQLITAPQAIEPMVKLFRSARQRLDTEQMGITSTWRLPATDSTPSQRIVNPWIQEFVDAARNGVKVRVLLNDASVFGADAAQGNITSANILNRAAHCYQIPLETRIASISGMQITYIHNKGVLVDDSTTLVSSINGTMNSSENNREVALLLKGTAANDYYSRAFNWDWNQSPKMSAPLPKTALMGHLMADCGVDSPEGTPILLRY